MPPDPELLNSIDDTVGVPAGTRRKVTAMLLLVEPPTTAALSLTNAASVNVIVRLEMVSVSAWFVAVPVRVSVTFVSLVRVSTAVSPSGTLLADTPAAVVPTEAAAKVSPESVATMLPVIVPSLLSASVSVPV